ncbi:hypothetical protein [Streptomyces sp. NPDC059906]|uniref:hypothetical protein n=1 Tax=Streptomyces sp. NPDC059906 TaxID=3346997 RepID=UPI00366A13AC
MGLGASNPKIVEGWHGMPFAQPTGRIRETVGILRAVLAAEDHDPAAASLGSAPHRRAGSGIGRRRGRVRRRLAALPLLPRGRLRGVGRRACCGNHRSARRTSRPWKSSPAASSPSART